MAASGSGRPGPFWSSTARTTPVATVPAARGLVEALPEGASELHVLPGAGHGVFREDPERAVALLREFVARTAAGKGE